MSTKVEMVSASLDAAKSKPEELIEVIRKIEARQIELAKRGDDLHEQLERKAEDFKAAQQELAELRARPGHEPNGSERSLKRYIGTDGGVRLLGGYDNETKEHVPGLLDDAKHAECEWHRDLLKATEDHNLAVSIKGKRNGFAPTAKRIARLVEKAPEFIKRAPGFEAKMRAFADSSGVGGDWIIDAGLPMVAMAPELVSDLAGRFQVHQMSSQTDLLPYMSNGLRPYKKIAASGDDPAQFSSSSIATTQRTIASTGMAVRAQVDRDASEDAIIAALPFVRQEIVKALRDGENDCLLNGDSAATHGDTGLANWNIRSRWGSTGLGGSNDHRRTYRGFRQYCLDVSGASGDQSAAETYNGTVAWRGKLTAPMGLSKDLLYVLSVEWYLAKVLTFAEFQTKEKVSGLASNETGIVANMGGVPVLIDHYMPHNLTVAGIYDNSSKVNTGGLLIDTSRWMISQRGAPVVELDTDITRDIYNVVAKNRRGLFTTGDGTTEISAYYAFKLTQ